MSKKNNKNRKKEMLKYDSSRELEIKKRLEQKRNNRLSNKDASLVLDKICDLALNDSKNNIEEVEEDDMSEDEVLDKRLNKDITKSKYKRPKKAKRLKRRHRNLVIN